jgi:hypothetical protein
MCLNTLSSQSYCHISDINNSSKLLLKNKVKNNSNIYYPTNITNDSSKLLLKNNDYNNSLSILLGDTIIEYNNIILKSSIDRYNNIFDKNENNIQKLNYEKSQVYSYLKNIFDKINIFK